MIDLTQEQINQLKALMQRVPNPPYKWSRCYEIENQKHWALTEPQSDAMGKVPCGYLILFCSSRETVSWSLEQEPLPALIAAALNALPSLIARWEESNLPTDSADYFYREPPISDVNDHRGYPDFYG